MKELINNLIQEGYLKTPRIIKAFLAIDRKDFVPESLKNEAYGNYPLSIGYGQTISQPLTLAFMIELLQPEKGDKILDVGSGSGWTTALLAEIAGIQRKKKEKEGLRKNIEGDGRDNKGRVYAIELIPELCEFGRQNTAKYFSVNQHCFKYFSESGKKTSLLVNFYCINAREILFDDSELDCILVSAAVFEQFDDILEVIPKNWQRSLRIKGKIVVPALRSLWLLKKISQDKWEKEEHPGFSFVPLISQ